MQPVSGNQRPDLLTCLTHVSLVLRPREMHLCRSSSNVPRLPTFLKLLQNPHILLTFDKVHNPLRLPRETTSARPKVVGTCSAFNILTWKCASRHYSMRFYNISNSKSAPTLVLFLVGPCPDQLEKTLTCKCPCCFVLEIKYQFDDPNSKDFSSSTGSEHAVDYGLNLLLELVKISIHARVCKNGGDEEWWR